MSGPLTGPQVDALIDQFQGLPRLLRVQVDGVSLRREQYAALIQQLATGPGVATVQAVVDGQASSVVILDGTAHIASGPEIAARQKEAEAEAAEMQALTSTPGPPTDSISLTLPAPQAHP